jgi:hypothetical protein
LKRVAEVFENFVPLCAEFIPFLEVVSLHYSSRIFRCAEFLRPLRSPSGSLDVVEDTMSVWVFEEASAGRQ